MLGLGRFPTTPLPPPPPQTPQFKTTPQNPIPPPLLFSNKTNQTHTHLFFPRFGAVLTQIRSGSCVFAIKSPRKGVDSLLEIDGYDDDYEGVEDFDDDDDDDEEMVVPLRNMKKWLEKKPRGFGEGKEYDTSIEDKLFEEMEQSRIAQLANIDKLKNNPQESNLKKEQLQKQKAFEAVPSGIRVRLVNLPKKKNIHRDLQLAFKGISGIINITPAVSGNKKTREPICKGIAFVDFKSEDEANRFVQTFTRQSIAFGKIQKQIKCEIVNSSSPNPGYKQLDKTDSLPQLAVPIMEKHLVVESEFDNPFLDSSEENFSDEYEGEDDEHVKIAIWEDTQENLGTFDSSELSGSDSRGQKKDSATDSLPSNQKQKIQENEIKLVAKGKAKKVPKLKIPVSANGEQRQESTRNSLSPKQQEKIPGNGKKAAAKRKGEKILKPNIPGSANRLKIKEKAVLTDVFSKYGVKKAPLAVNEQR